MYQKEFNEMKMHRSNSIEDIQIEHVTDHDALQLKGLGYEQQMQRKFSSLQLICYAFVATNSWLGLAGGLPAGIRTGGTVCIIWGLVIATFANMALGCALSELVSAYPNSGGTYFWAMQLAPRRYARISAYVTGWANLFGAWCVGAANMTIITAFILATARLYRPDIVLHPWQYYLTAVAINTGLGVCNLSLSVLTKASMIGCLTSVLALICVTVAVPASAQSFTSAKFIFTSTENVSGWDSFGMAFITGLVNASWCYGILDSATHLAEEIPQPQRNVPKALLSTVSLGFITTFPLACLLMYSLRELDKVVAAEMTGSPLVELIYLSSGRSDVTLALTICIIVPFVFAVISVHTYQSRLLWAFSRDRGVPLSRIWCAVDQRLGVPVSAHLLGLGVNMLIAALQLVSTTAYNSFLSGGLVFPLLSCILPISWSLWRGSDQKRGPFNLGALGVAAKVTTLVYCSFTVVMYSFPYVMPATPNNMNYISAVYACFAIFLVVDWLARARSAFTVNIPQQWA